MLLGNVVDFLANICLLLKGFQRFGRRAYHYFSIRYLTIYRILSFFNDFHQSSEVPEFNCLKNPRETLSIFPGAQANGDAVRADVPPAAALPGLCSQRELVKGLLSPPEQEENAFPCWARTTLDLREGFFTAQIREAQMRVSSCQGVCQTERQDSTLFQQPQ